MHWRASDIVSTLDVCVQDIGYENCRCLVDAALGHAVVLVDDDRVSDSIHVNVIEGYFRYRT